MSTLYVLAGVELEGEIVGSFGVESSTSTGSVKKPVIGGIQPREKMRSGDKVLSFSGKLMPLSLGGMTELAELERHVDESIPTLVMRGGVVSLGWFIITKFSARGSRFTGPNAGVVQVSMTLERSKPGSVSQIVPVLKRLMQRLAS